MESEKLMAYCARYRFKILSALQIPDGAPLTLVIPGLPPATLEVGKDAYPFGTWAVLKMMGFATEGEARSAGQRLGDTLLVVGAITKLGIDVGFSRSTLQFGSDIHAAMLVQTGRQLRTETHGLMVYEKDTVSIVGMDARGSALLAPDALEQRIGDWIGSTSHLTERQRNCAALLNDSFFVPQSEGQFILRVSAIEALCDQTDLDPDYQAAITAIEGFVAGQPFANEIRDTINGSLAFQKKKSVRQSYMTKFRVLMSDDAANAFDALYKKRSKLVHEGQGRGDLTQASDEALHLAVDILSADLNQQSTTAS